MNDLFRPKSGEIPKDNKYYRKLYPQIIDDINVSAWFIADLSSGSSLVDDSLCPACW